MSYVNESYGTAVIAGNAKYEFPAKTLRAKGGVAKQKVDVDFVIRAP